MDPVLAPHALPGALLSVASVPAMGLIGAHLSELPAELLGESDLGQTAASTAAPNARAVEQSQKRGGLAHTASVAAPSGTAEVAPAHLSMSASAPCLGAATSVAGAPSPGAASTGGTGNALIDGLSASRKKTSTLKERSHAMASLVRNSQSTLSMDSSSPFVLAQRYAFLNHCLCCNVLCKSCVLGEGEAEKLEQKIAPTKELVSRRRGGITSDGLADSLIELPTGKKKRVLTEEERHAKIILGIGRSHDQSSQIGDRNKQFKDPEATKLQQHWQTARASVATDDGRPLV